MHIGPDIALVGSGEMRLSDPMDCNVYAVDCPDGVVLIDTGVGEATEQIIANAEDAFGSTPSDAVLTHAHADHAQGAPALQAAGVRVWATEATAALTEAGTTEELGLDRAKRSGIYPADYSYAHFRPDRVVEADTTVGVAGGRFELLAVRGHARDHSCILYGDPAAPAGFVGDALRADGSIILLNMPGSSLAAYREDLGRLGAYPIDRLLPGHGYPLFAEGEGAVTRAIEGLRSVDVPV